MLWASLLAASAEAEAEGREADAKRFAERAAQVRGAVKRANDRMIKAAERELAFVRTGHHSATSGEWRLDMSICAAPTSPVAPWRSISSTAVCFRIFCRCKAPAGSDFF